MANNNYNLSTHQIDQLQISLRKEAGINSPFTFLHHHSSDSFLKEAIVGSNLCSDVPRCNSCNGDLLSGSHSFICIYCGLPQHPHSLPNSISFNSTFAFRWILKSLGLDANETVGIPVGGTQSGDRGRGSIKVDEIPLSEFLDLKLKWGDHFRGFGLKDNEQGHGKRYLSLIGVDIEEILSQESMDHGSSVSNEQVVVNPDVENEEFRVLGERNLRVFENVQPSDSTMKLSEGRNNESFADWGAEFQSSTTPDPGHEKSLDISSFDDNSRSNLNVSGVQSLEFKRLDENTSIDSLNNDKNDGNDDSFDEWGDFRMSRTGTITQGEPISVAGLAPDNSDEVGITDSYNDLSKDIQVQKDNFTVPDDAWNDLMIPSSGGNIPSEINRDKTELHAVSRDLALGKETGLALLNDAFLEHQGVHVESTQNKVSDQIDSLGLLGNEIHLDSRGDLILHIESKLPPGEGNAKLDDSFDLWNGFSGSENQQATNTEVVGSKLSGLGMEKIEEQDGVKVNGNQSEQSGLRNDNSLDEWSDFTGSVGLSNSKPIANDDSFGEWSDFSSLMITPENTRNNSARTYVDQPALEDDDLFSSLSDFQSSGFQTGVNSVGLNANKTSSDQISFEKSPNSPKNGGDNNPIDSWGDFGGVTSKTNLSNGDDDLFSGFGNSVKQSTSQPDSQLHMFEGNFMDKNDDSFAWGDFTTSNNAEVNVSNTVNGPTLDNKEGGDQGDILASWNGIANSPNVQASKDNSSVIGDNPGSNLFSMLTDQNGSAPIAFVQSGVSDSVRTEHGDVKDGDYFKVNISEHSLKEGTDSKASIAESLISEMHDLSFMLESSLSIPNSGT